MTKKSWLVEWVDPSVGVVRVTNSHRKTKKAAREVILNKVEGAHILAVQYDDMYDALTNEATVKRAEMMANIEL